MAQVKFYRGSQGESLPENFEDGAIYVIKDTASLDDNVYRGDLYIDTSSNSRIQIQPKITPILKTGSTDTYTLTFGN